MRRGDRWRAVILKMGYRTVEKKFITDGKDILLDLTRSIASGQSDPVVHLKSQLPKFALLAEER
jgi:hypothetical protein